MVRVAHATELRHSRAHPPGVEQRARAHRLDDRYRRNLLVAAGSGEGPLTEPTAAAQLWEREPLLMPRSCPPGGSETRAVCSRQKIMVSPFNDHRRGDLVRF